MPPQKNAPEDQPDLLSGALLRCSEQLRTVEIRSDRVAIKYITGGTYLVVTHAQKAILDRFALGRSAPQVLCDLLSERLSPPLREYYELLIKAVRAGVLETAGVARPRTKPSYPWRWKIQGRLGRFFALTTMTVATILITTNPLVIPTEAHQLILGWFLVCIGVSIGEFVGGCVLRGEGAEIYTPRHNLRSLIPGFRFDHADSIMLGREAGIEFAIVRIAPLFLAAAFGTLWYPPVVLPLFCGLLYQLCPVPGTPMTDFLRASYKDPRLDTTYDFRFAQNQVFLVLLRSRLKFADRRFLLMSAGYTVVWLGLVFLVGSSFLHANAQNLLELVRVTHGVQITAVILLVVMGLLVITGAGLALWFVWRHLRAVISPWLARRAARRLRPKVAPESILRCLASTHLFKDLPSSDLAILGTVVKTEEFKRRALVVRQGEHGDRLYIVFSGAVNVIREPSVGKAEIVAELLPGAIFGEIALLRGGVRTRSVRTSCPTVLLSITKDDFAGLILSRLSRETVETAVQKLSFLARIPLSRPWSPAAMNSFVRRSAFKEYTNAEILVREGEANPFFHVVHEGEFSVQKGGFEVARLRVGDFFGEISLLQSSVATATIVALSPARCLLMHRRDFLDFITQDFLIGLQFEAISSERLGQPIFPLGRSAFAETRSN